MREFDDPGLKQATVRLGDVYEVVHRIRRLGIRKVEVKDPLEVHFYDHRVHAEVRLEILPWFREPTYWIWYATVSYPDGFFSGPLAAGRRVMINPYPRQVVRAYQQEVKLERGSLPVKRCS